MSDKRAVYRMIDLRARYECSEVTIRRWMKQRGFPKAIAPGRWLIESVRAWEQKQPFPNISEHLSGQTEL